MFRRADLTILGANIAGRVHPARLGSDIARHKPHVVVVTEAHRARAYLDGIPGYKLRQYGPWAGAEAPGIAVLVRSRIPIRWRRIMRMHQPWWFNNRKRQPRRYQKLTMLLRRLQRWPILAVHFPPGGPSGGGRATGGRNGPAWHESRNRAGRWGRRRKRGAIVGDLNAVAHELEGLTREVGGELAMGGKVDACIAIGAHVRSQRLDPPPGCHGWALYRLTAR